MMRRMIMASVALGFVVLIGWAVIGQAQHDHGHPVIKEQMPVEPSRDEREALRLDAQAEAGLKLTMREHLEAIRDIIAALGRQEFEQAAKVSHEELGFPKHHQAMEREAGATFPPKYHDLAMAHHQEAEDLATALPTKDFQRILPHLEKTIGACVACHRTYKL